MEDRFQHLLAINRAIAETLDYEEVLRLVVDKTVAAVTAIADRIVILVKGEVVFEDTPARLAADPHLMHRHLGV